MAFPNGKYYVGQTRRPLAERLRSHKFHVARGRTPLYAAIRKYGWPVVFEAGEYPNGELDLREQQLIVNLNTVAPNGYNITRGGDSNPMLTPRGRAQFDARVRAPERLAKISAASKARKRKSLTAEQRAACGIANKGRTDKRGAAFYAKQQGLKRYYGAPCQKCNGTERYTANQMCVPCLHAANNARR